LIIRWPGKVDHLRLNRPVSSIDIAPTVLKAAGLTPSPDLPGIDLLDRTSVANRGPVFGSVFTHDILDLTDPVASLKHRWIIQGRWKLIVSHSPNILDAEVRLYDVVADPDETIDLIFQKTDLVKRLFKQLNHWWPVE
jgi:uncharacterized sulfatase